MAELGYVVESCQHFVEILASFQNPQIPGKAGDTSARARRKIRQQLEHRMPRDTWLSCGGSPKEIVTKYLLQVVKCLFRLLFFKRLKAIYSFEAFDVVFPRQELHSTVLP